MLCYCVQFSAARWFASHGARRWLMQPVAYCVILCAAGLPFVIAHPSILVWAPVMAALAAVSFVAAWKREERSLWSNAAAVCASCLLAALTFGYGCAGASDIPCIGRKGLLLSCVCGMVQFGSVLFVKTMIRERGSRAYVIASWGWHTAVLAAAVYEGNAMLVLLGMLLLVRAVATPIVAMRHAVRPLHTGLVELATSALSLILIVAAMV